jgi:hypothetical protein
MRLHLGPMSAFSSRRLRVELRELDEELTNRARRSIRSTARLRA